MNLTPYELFKNLLLSFSNFLACVFDWGDSCCSKTPNVGNMFRYSTDIIFRPYNNNWSSRFYSKLIHIRARIHNTKYNYKNT